MRSVLLLPVILASQAVAGQPPTVFAWIDREGGSVVRAAVAQRSGGIR